jgi:hypothetical protein
MSRFAGLVGYVTQEETSPGVWSPVNDSKMMRGDIIRQGLTSSDNGKVNGDISLNHRVSLMGDKYAFDNCYYIKWVEINSLKWEVTSVELQRPRIILTLGGLWNGY